MDELIATDAATDAAPDHAPTVAARLGPMLFRCGLFATYSYAIIVFGYGDSIAGLRVGHVESLMAIAGLFATIELVTARSWFWATVSPIRQFEAGLALTTLIGAILSADIGYGVYENRHETPGLQTVRTSAAEDVNLWSAQVSPPRYFPSGGQFQLHKPGVTLTGTFYGGEYRPPMTRSRTLADSALEPHEVTYQIGSTGLRETKPLLSSHVFALGDSFVYGNSTNLEQVWTEVLAKRLGQPIYNLGISGVGPPAEVSLLKYMLAAHRDSMRVRELIWMLFEGNDLEDASSHEDTPAGHGIGVLIEGTLLQLIDEIPTVVKEESILRKLVRHEFLLARPMSNAGTGIPSVDGVVLHSPLYRSPVLGLKFFERAHIDHARAPLSYVLDHPGRPAIEEAFRDMHALSKRYGFHVTVVIAPSDARLQGPLFDGFPRLADEPYLIDWFAKTARSQGFGTVDLLPLLAPYAGKELLYYRDDTHWNVRGNDLVGRILADYFQREGGKLLPGHDSARHLR